jgi:hypothetical protein
MTELSRLEKRKKDRRETEEEAEQNAGSGNRHSCFSVPDPCGDISPTVCGLKITVHSLRLHFEFR